MARLITFLASLKQAVTDSYQPSKHYMRGPGPKWHKKHGSLHKNSGGNSRLVVDTSDLTRVSPNARRLARR